MIKFDIKTSFKAGPEPKFPIKCPKCGKASKHRLSELKQGTRVTCPSCGGVLHIQNRGFETAGQSLKNLLKKR